MVSFILNGKKVSSALDPMTSLREALVALGCSTVRDSDDGEGFAGSDSVIFNDEVRYSNLIPLFMAEGAEIRTAESLIKDRKLNDVQRAMVAAGVVQSAYNSPTVALILTHLLEHKGDATREDVKDALSSVFIRDAGYEHFYLAVKLVQEERREGHYVTPVSPSFRPELDVIGKPTGKIDGDSLVRGEKVFVEDKVMPGA